MKNWCRLVGKARRTGLPVYVLMSIITSCLEAESVSEQSPMAIVDTFAMITGDELGQWKAAPHAFEGDLEVRDGVLNTGLGSYLTGVVWKTEPPARNNYEIELEARIVWGSDFFLGLTIPVDDRYCTWIVGGWGGRIVGISNIDGHSADDNETTRKMSFEDEYWYRCKIRVVDKRIQCWIDGTRVIDLDANGKDLSLRPGPIEGSVPLGIASYDTISEYRNMVWRTLAPEVHSSSQLPK